MRILIDIGHPGHVHLFRPFTKEMMKRGHVIFFTCRQKEFEIELLEASAFDYKCFGLHYKSFPGKIWGLVKFNIQMILIAVKFKPDVFLSHGSIYAAQVAWLLRKPHISLEDSGNMEQIKFYLPFTKVVITPDVLPINLGEKHIRYKGYHELAYLHPKYFTQVNSILTELGISNDQEYAILRFISWKATHDKGNKGLTVSEKQELINYLISKNLKVFISSESYLPIEFRNHQINISPNKIHHVLAFARIVISEGATIASESGVLGTPTIYVNSIERCYNEDQEKNYGTVQNLRTGEYVLKKVDELLSVNRKISPFNSKILNDKIDVTAFFIWFIENWPESFYIMKKNPEYQERFKSNFENIV